MASDSVVQPVADESAEFTCRTGRLKSTSVCRMAIVLWRDKLREISAPGKDRINLGYGELSIVSVT